MVRAKLVIKGQGFILLEHQQGGHPGFRHGLVPLWSAAIVPVPQNGSWMAGFPEIPGQRCSPVRVSGIVGWVVAAKVMTDLADLFVAVQFKPLSEGPSEPICLDALEPGRRPEPAGSGRHR